MEKTCQSLVLLVVILSEVASVHSAPNTLRSSLAIDGPKAEEYEVWSLAIKNVLEDSQPPKTVLINNETVSPTGSEYDLEPLLDSRPKLPYSRRTNEWNALKADLLAQTLADFEERNQSTELLLNKFHLPLRTQTITERELSELSSKAPAHFWETLREKYPHAIGVFRVSRIGFSSSRTQAVVYVEYRSGPEGGDGRYVLLGKENNAWTCIATAIVWMS